MRTPLHLSALTDVFVVLLFVVQQITAQAHTLLCLLRKVSNPLQFRQVTGDGETGSRVDLSAQRYSPR